MIVAYFGWRTHTVVNPDEEQYKASSGDLFGLITPLPDIGNLSPSLGLGAIGMPGNSAYFGKNTTYLIEYMYLRVTNWFIFI